jgi:hypothetical protein
MQIMITKSEARNLLCEYIATIDRGKLREWPNFFAETSVYRIATRENEERGLPLSIMLCNRLKARGGAGIVTDGGYRDTHEVASLGFPAYQTRTVPPPSFLHLHAVEMNQPIGCARVAVYPGRHCSRRRRRGGCHPGASRQ